MTQIPRSEYPRPDFVREPWLALNGEWDFSFGDSTFDQKIVVPFACESQLSGIGKNGLHHTVWYRREFTIPDSMKGKHIILHFGAVDYYCRVWVNDVLVAEHEGGQSSFCADITQAVTFTGSNTVVVKVIDEHTDLEKPRGKQFWEVEPRSIFYSRTTGIWQSVWIEAVSKNHLQSVKITPLLDEKAVRFEYILEGGQALSLETQIWFGGGCVNKLTVEAQSRKGSYTVSLDQPALNAWNFYEDLTWSPETPRLFDVVFTVYDGATVTDTVKSYFGMRKVSIDDGVFMLNNRPYYQKLLLNQGYWPESLLTAPSDEAFVKDITLIKEMGFNGVRVHQKVEDPRFLYHADRLGLLVWGEIGSAYLYSREYANRMYREWADVVMRDYNHPCIVVWTPLNESWGIQEVKTNEMQQAHCNAMYFITKSLDSTRPVIDNDGWEHTCGDILTIHDYESSHAVMGERYRGLDSILAFAPGGRSLFVPGWAYASQPVIVSEFGGILYAKNKDDQSWGYYEVKTAEGFIEQYHAIIDALLQSDIVQGFCYTQFTDIETEANGLLTYDRTPKVPLDTIRKINEGRWEKALCEAMKP